MQANKPYISTGLRHIFAIVSSQISTMMEPFNGILEHEPTNRRLEISPRAWHKFPIQSFYYPWLSRPESETRSWYSSAVLLNGMI